MKKNFVKRVKAVRETVVRESCVLRLILLLLPLWGEGRLGLFLVVRRRFGGGTFCDFGCSRVLPLPGRATGDFASVCTRLKANKTPREATCSSRLETRSKECHEEASFWVVKARERSESKIIVGPTSSLREGAASVVWESKPKHT